MMKRLLFLALITVLLLAGCGEAENQQPNIDLSGIRPETTENMVPDETETVQTTERIIFTAAYISSYGIDGEMVQGDAGWYYAYTGGQMTLELTLSAENLQEEGVAVMLFLNGQPQPYALEESEETAYLHMVYPENRKECRYKVNFTPVTGEAGEMAELCVLYFPSYYSDPEPESNRMSYQEDGIRIIMARIRMEQTPPEAVLPEVMDRVQSWAVSWEDSTRSWAEGKVNWNVGFCNKMQNGTIIHDYDTLKPVDVSFQMYGDPSVEYVLVIYVGGEPVFLGGEAISVQAEDGKKLIIDAELDNSDGQGIIFAILMRKNCYGDGWEYCPEENDLKVIHLKTGE